MTQLIQNVIDQHIQEISEKQAQLERLRKGDTTGILFDGLGPPGNDQINERIVGLEKQIKEEQELIDDLKSLANGHHD